MKDLIDRTALRCIELLLRPIARMCLRHSIGFREFSNISKAALLVAAKEELESRGISPSASRLSVMTGLQRRDIAEIGRTQTNPLLEQQASICNRVIGQWLSDRRFIDRNKDPRLLSVAGKKSEFAKLLRVVSTDLNHYAVLFELERIGAVERVGNKVRLVTDAYVARADAANGYYLLSQDASSLISAVEENLLGSNEIPNLHAKTCYDNIDPKDIPHIRKWLIRFGHRVHSQARKFLAAYDRDINSSHLTNSARSKVTLATFSFSESVVTSKKRNSHGK